MIFQINKVTLDGVEYELAQPTTGRKNLISVMTGKNGAGKSRILEFIASNFLVSDNFLMEHPENWSKRFNAITLDYSNNQVQYQTGTTECSMQRIEARMASVFKTPEYIENRHDVFPRKLICLSTSPFDRFPLNSSKTAHSNSIYSYIGMKNSKRSSSVVSLISNVLDSMFKVPENIESNVEVIKKTLSYLGYGNRILVSYRSNFKLDFNNLSRANVSEMLKKKDTPLFDKYLINERGWEQSIDDIYRNIKTLTSSSNKWKTTYSVPINLSKTNLLEDSYIKAIQVLSQNNLFSIKSLKLSRADDNRKFVDFTSASSGEQCLALMLLGIASQIEDGSLICIDEPEISLHPEWQEEFIPLLESLFSNYTGCHFLIATHSPLLISKLTGSNCYILDLDENKLFNTLERYNYSSDYQLATLFKSPGFKNEYLINESLDILNTLSKPGDIGREVLDRSMTLISLKEKLEDEDPVYSLITTIERVLEAINND
ncbi:TPA: AAA family ATPase [Vibrio vulnificus]|uniref:AAA family ATPase n=2 Tax=Vibrio vulnificus TaxID=672 RepID=UPI00092603EE|nr:ATP-binding protein [Vibrio vulnificus]OJI57423.1 hypothetical protein VFL11327_02599 [Vibrio fluvialis]EHD0093939.1 ATP-binding protein [Vibrio vulnificus]EHD0095128.1 ATP-binding protein [Vibrio vulnificus]EIA1299764.1 ATP-binding protein [Vibrio vulnificus]EIA1300698.1 ATP-binding protein [Vibrio vulnificus]